MWHTAAPTQEVLGMLNTWQQHGGLLSAHPQPPLSSFQSPQGAGDLQGAPCM